MLYFSSIAFMIDDLKNRYGSFHGNPKENKGIKNVYAGLYLALTMTKRKFMGEQLGVAQL